MIERDETGRRWFVRYRKTITPSRPPAELHCPDHPDTRLVRILGGTWICEDCVRARPDPGD